MVSLTNLLHKGRQLFHLVFILVSDIFSCASLLIWFRPTCVYSSSFCLPLEIMFFSQWCRGPDHSYFEFQWVMRNPLFVLRTEEALNEWSIFSKNDITTRYKLVRPEGKTQAKQHSVCCAGQWGVLGPLCRWNTIQTHLKDKGYFWGCHIQPT